LKNDGSSVTVTASCLAADGSPGTGSVTFTTAVGTLNGTAGQAAVALAAGTASVTFACNASSDPNCSPGSIILNARWDNAVSAVHLTLLGAGGTGGTDAGSGGTDAGSGGTDGGSGGGTGTVPAYVLSKGATPSALGIKGSGIQESGVATFVVTDPYGLPVPGAAVNFGQQSPQLVTLNSTSGVSGADGTLQLAYTSQTEVGVTTLTATLVATGSVARQTVAVRGAKPSASGFYFRCEHASLPVYTTVAEFETMTCTVRLSDRYGNRVGIPTVVAFATEAGSISATALTKAFDPSNPTDPDEGSATVTFTTDMGNGNSPADVAPLGVATQYPWNRAAEPFHTPAGSSVTDNPRDQLVTIIAMTRGEEAFEDANHNGLLDANEVFVDQGDPFIDENDDGVYDQIGPSAAGVWEPRFCGLNADCSTYHGPNGVWDSDTVIWKPTWVVFTGVGGATTTPAGGATPASDFTPGCADYSDAIGVGHQALITAPVYVYDHWLNLPSGGTTVKAGSTSKQAITAAYFGPGALLESWGSMGTLGIDFDWVRVAASGPNAGKECNIANGQACVEKLLFRDFADGGVGQVTALNGVTAPTTPASTTGYGCAPNQDQFGSLSFLLDIDVGNLNGVTVSSIFTGTYAHGTGP
jgi:hypothetical protein